MPGHSLWRENVTQEPRIYFRGCPNSGLGIGATTAIVSLINAVLLEPLPYEQSGDLVNIWEMRTDGKSGDVSPGAFIDWREYSRSFEGMSSERDAAANLAVF